MSGTNGGTGQPIWFCCSECRKTRDGRTNGGPYDAILTGRTRKAPQGNTRGRNSSFRFEYHCQYCGHVGWSRHVDLEDVFKKQFGKKSLVYDNNGFLREVKIPW